MDPTQNQNPVPGSNLANNPSGSSNLPPTLPPKSNSPLEEPFPVTPQVPALPSKPPVTPPQENSQSVPIGVFNLPSEGDIAEVQKNPPQESVNSPKAPVIPPPPSSPPPGPLVSELPRPTVNPTPRQAPLPPLAQAKKKSQGSYLQWLVGSLVIIVLVAASGFGLLYAGINVPVLSQYFDFNQKDFTQKLAQAKSVLAKDQDYSLVAFIQVNSAESNEVEIQPTNAQGIIQPIAVAISQETDNLPSGPPALPGSEIIPDNNSLPENSTETETEARVETQTLTNAEANYNITLVANHNGQKNTSGTIVVSPSDTLGNIFELSFDFAADDSVLYLKPKGLYVERASNWQKISLDELTETPFAIFTELNQLDRALERLQDGSWSALEEVSIKNQKDELVATIQANKFQVTSVNLDSLAIKDLNTTIYFAKSGSHPVKISASGQGSAGKLSQVVQADYYYFNFGTPAEVTIPDPESTENSTLDKFLTSYGFRGVVNDSGQVPDEPDQPPITPPEDKTEADKRDETRRADLEKILAAAENYKKDTGTYPIVKEVEKTNQSTLLKSVLVPKYLESLPVDPQDPQYWYGYNSDGYTLRITSIVEGLLLPGKQGKTVKYQEISR